MIYSKIFDNRSKYKKLISTAEAFSLWDMLSSKYSALERMQIWENYAHDRDLKYFLTSIRKSMEKNVKIIEKKTQQFGIMGPDGRFSDIRAAVNSEIVRDEFIARDLLEFVQESVTMLIKAIRSSITNDEIRELWTNIFKEAVDATNDYIKYLKLKGWLNIPPIYPHIPSGTTEKIDVGEAFSLWDHLAFRYDNIELTQYFYAYANDFDFKTLLKEGFQEILKKQAKMLEKELRQFGIPLPVKPPNVVPSVENTNLMYDDNIFRQLFFGVQGAVIIHTHAFLKSTTNDRIRKIFKELLMSEVSIQENLILFGKLKGWLNPAPEYGAKV